MLPATRIFTFSLTPGASLGGSTSYAGTYDYTGSFTNNNLTAQETTSISVFANNCVVPNVVGLSQAAAESALTAAQCTVGAVTSAKSDSAAGTVMSSSPGAGTKLDPDAAVALVVSGTARSPRSSARCRRSRDSQLGAAESKIRSANCSVGKVTRKKSSAKHRGHVLSESPSGGSSEADGTKVDLTVGK